MKKHLFQMCILVGVHPAKILQVCNVERFEDINKEHVSIICLEFRIPLVTINNILSRTIKEKEVSIEDFILKIQGEGFYTVQWLSKILEKQVQERLPNFKVVNLFDFENIEEVISLVEEFPSVPFNFGSLLIAHSVFDEKNYRLVEVSRRELTFTASFSRKGKESRKLHLDETFLNSSSKESFQFEMAQVEWKE